MQMEGGMHKPCGQPSGEGRRVHEMSTNKAHLVKTVHEGGGGQKSPKYCPHGSCMPPNSTVLISQWAFFQNSNLSESSKNLIKKFQFMKIFWLFRYVLTEILLYKLTVGRTLFYWFVYRQYDPSVTLPWLVKFLE